MLDLQEIEKRINEHKEILQKEYNIKHLAIFGSFLTGDIHPKSDVNIIINVDQDLKQGLIARARLKNFLEELLERDCSVIVDRKNMAPSSIDAKTLKHEIF